MNTLPGWEYDVKATRKQFDMLLANFSSDEAKSLKSSGIEEDYSECTQLLTDIKEILSSDMNRKDEEATRTIKLDEQNRVKAAEVRDAAMEGLQKGDSPSQLKSGRYNVENLFKEKEEKAELSRSEELEFKKYKFNALLKEREKDRELEMKRLEIQQKAQDNQALIMQALLEIFIKK